MRPSPIEVKVEDMLLMEIIFILNSQVEPYNGAPHIPLTGSVWDYTKRIQSSRVFFAARPINL